MKKQMTIATALTNCTASGQSVGNIRIATSENFRDRDGNRQERTEWHNVVLWGRLAELAQQYLGKGRRVYIEGRLQTRSWEDQQSGQRRYATEIVGVGFFREHISL